LWWPKVEKKKIDKYEMYETKLENAKIDRIIRNRLAAAESGKNEK